MDDAKFKFSFKDYKICLKYWKYTKEWFGITNHLQWAVIDDQKMRAGLYFRYKVRNRENEICLLKSSGHILNVSEVCSCLFFLNPQNGKI